MTGKRGRPSNESKGLARLRRSVEIYAEALQEIAQRGGSHWAHRGYMCANVARNALKEADSQQDAAA